LPFSLFPSHRVQHNRGLLVSVPKACLLDEFEGTRGQPVCRSTSPIVEGGFGRTALSGRCILTRPPLSVWREREREAWFGPFCSRPTARIWCSASLHAREPRANGGAEGNWQPITPWTGIEPFCTWARAPSPYPVPRERSSRCPRCGSETPRSAGSCSRRPKQGEGVVGSMWIWL
jgi:hypothetical protein